MMRVIQRVACVAVLVAAAGHVQAGIIVVDPDGFASGTSLTYAFTGVTITRGSGATDITSALGSTGTQQFSLNGRTGFFNSLPNPPSATLVDTLAASRSSSSILRFDFSTPTDFVSIDLIPNDSLDPGSIAAFDSAGNQIGFDSFGGQNLRATRNTLSVSGGGITTLLAAGDNLGNTLEIDTLTYSSTAAVPEPSTLALFGIGAGVAGIGATRRRRREWVNG
ncbi:PEP-CTERM sorting domain-containing protein [Aureliella helgolandensis]|uniref:PEP-CTERM motif protein n=1 Tax=Aureliella helgolandensis TaxID=2527968 RepID=A0A518GAN7_9BACT|nr:PEP-CTERM sorting domain-containing protein [Aureliella helgolandensis]QDV25665.1 PEP-CTERM motif protein [Aureliella helgolandensis]